MKNKVVAIIICIIVMVVTIILIPKDKQYTYSNDGVMYAITEDGVSKDTFPSKGAYIVDVKCNNATGKWLYDDWKLAIEDISGNVYCDVDFTSITTKTYLNEYITNLATNSPEQGTGKLVHEYAGLPSDYTSVAETSYVSPTAYIGASYSSTSGTSVSVGTDDNSLFRFDGTNWNTTPSLMESKNYYHMQFTVPEEGYYQLCYTMSSGYTNNRLYLYKGTTHQTIRGSVYLNASTSSEQTGCIDLPRLTTSDTLRVVQRAYSSSSYPIAQVSFNLQKAAIVENVDAGIRYEGKNPNNYIWFNNELWRIIGVFGSESHGQSGEQLVKIIRANSIGGLAWDKSNTSDWSVSSLKTLLNGSYYDYETNGYDSTNCYGYSTTSTANCDYSDIGMNGSYRPMIKNVTWYLRGHKSNTVTVEAMYNLERTTGTVYDTTRPTEDTGYIGLMYPSDYGYSVLADDCARITNLNSYDGTCASNSWMYGQGYESTITPFTGRSDAVFYLTYDGYFYYYIVSYGHGVRPVLYLDSSVYVINASSDNIGSKANPYIIGM